MKTIKYAIVALSIAAASQFAMAEGEATETAPAAAASSEMAPAEDANHDAFVKLDKNGDGMIDKAEAKADKGLAKAFAKIAKKGKLNEDGYKAWKNKG